MTRLGVDLTACWRPRVGMVTLALELTRAMIRSRSDVSVTLFCSRDRPPGLEAEPAQAIISPHRHEVANKLLWLPAVEVQAALDAILYPYWPSPPFRLASAPPAAIFVHDLAFRVRPAEVPWQQRAYLGSVMPAALAGAAAVIVPSHSTASDLLDSYPFEGLADRVHVIPEGPATLGEAGGELPSGLEPGFLLAVGTIEPRKNYSRLVAAYRRVKARLPDAPQLAVVGRTGWAYGSALDELREEPGVRLLGHVPDAILRRLYREAVLLAFPSVYEGFGLLLLEAMGEGLPALVGSAGALPELAAGAALEVDVLDPEAIADGLHRMLTDSGLRTRLAEAGKRRAQEFSWELAAAATIRVLGTIARDHGQLD